MHLPEALGGKSVAALAARDFRTWRDGLIRRKLSPATINRINAGFKAEALNLAADDDERIVHRVWERALPSIPDAAVARNVILPEDDVRSIIAAAYAESAAFGLFVEVAAVTGARPSQMWRLEVGDVQGERDDPRLMMPASKKGRGQKKIARRPVPVPADLIARLRHAAGHRPSDAPLLLKPSGEAWAKSDHLRLFTRVVERVGLGDVTLYALRHSNIVEAFAWGRADPCGRGQSRYQRGDDREELLGLYRRPQRRRLAPRLARYRCPGGRQRRQNPLIKYVRCCERADLFAAYWSCM